MIDPEASFLLNSLTDEQGFEFPWQMTRCERFALQGLLRRWRLVLAVEIGTYHSGSLHAFIR